MATILQIIDHLRSLECEVPHTIIQPELEIFRPNNIADAGIADVTFVNEKFRDAAVALVKASQSKLIIIEESLVDLFTDLAVDTNLVFGKNAKELILRCANQFFHIIHERNIHSSVEIPSSASIGKNCHIEQGVVIEEHVVIGDHCIIESNVKLSKGTKIGNHVHIKSNTVIGGNGFGYVKNGNGEYEHLPHFGGVIIEDHVHIGSNTCVDRGSLSNTLIRKGVKIDNLVHIAHNVEIGENSLIIACSMIAGSTKIGENAWIAPAASVRNGLSIGKDSVVGLGSVVVKNVEAGTTVAGVPAKKI